jgi:hypothetical protein
METQKPGQNWYGHLDIPDWSSFVICFITRQHYHLQTPSSRSTKSRNRCLWRAPYIHQVPSYKLEGILCLLVKDGREIMPTCRCKNPPTIESRHRNPPIICLMIYGGLVHDKFCLVLYDR